MGKEAVVASLTTIKTSLRKFYSGIRSLNVFQRTAIHSLDKLRIDRKILMNRIFIVEPNEVN